jgi:DDE family transposase
MACATPVENATGPGEHRRSVDFTSIKLFSAYSGRKPLEKQQNNLTKSLILVKSNGYRMLLHVVAYGLVVLLREAAAGIAEVATARVSTLRSRLWKVGAWVEEKAGQIWLHVSASWPGQELWQQVQRAVERFSAALAGGGAVQAVGN